MTGAGVPEEFLPDGHVVVSTPPVCPGCDREFSPPELEYTGTEYRGETWHIECMCQDHPEIEETDTARYCPNCRAFSRWHREGTPSTARICVGCGWSFKQTPTKDRVLAQTGGVL